MDPEPMPIGPVAALAVVCAVAAFWATMILLGTIPTVWHGWH